MIPYSNDTPIPTPPVSLHQRTDRELELAVLERIHTETRVRQRDLAEAVGASLGMTNAIVKRLSRKGLLTLRKVNNRNVVYAVTPAGLEAITRKSYRYLKNTIRSVVQYRDTLDALVVSLKRSGFRRIVVVGRSDLAFVLEHLCTRYNIQYRQQNSLEIAPGAADDGDFLLYAEHIAPESIQPCHGRDSLLRILAAAPDNQRPSRDTAGEQS